MVDTERVAHLLIDRIIGQRDLRSSIQSDRYDILSDNYDKYIRARICERFGVSTRAAGELISKFLDKSANVYKYIIRLLSVVYKEPPSRTFRLRADTKLWDKVVDSNDLDSLMERVNQITTACNECFLRPVVRDGEVDFDLVLPHSVEVYSDGANLQALIYPVEGNDGAVQYEYWDSEYKLVFDKDGHPVQGLSSAHGYGVLPVVVYRRMRPAVGFWLGLDGQDLVYAFDDQIMGRTWINRISYVQSYSQVYREKDEGLGDNTSIDINSPTFGPDSIPVGKYRTLDLRTDLRSQLDVLETKLQRVASNWGISSDALNQSKHSSGLERLLSFSGLLEYRLQTIKHYRPRDKELMRVACAVWNVDGDGSKFSTDPDPRINYAEPRLVESQIDRVALQEKEEAIGAASPVDYIMARDPDIASRNEAMDIVKRNLEELKVVQEHKRSFQEPANQDPEQKAAEGAMGGRPEKTDPSEVSTELEDNDNGE